MKITKKFTSSKQINALEHLTQWLGTTIAKKQSFLPTVEEIINHQVQNEVTTIGLQGREGTGKSTLSHILAHLIHEGLAKKATAKTIPDEIKKKISRGYDVHFFGDHELINFQATLDKLPETNRIIVFDDVSFLNGKTTKRELDHLKNVFTTIRHTNHGEDYKTVLMFCYHYSRGLDVYLRDTVVKYFTSIAAEEAKNIKSLIGGMNSKTISIFQKKYADFSKGKAISFKVGGTYMTKKSRIVTYRYGEPFRLGMYFNNSGIRLFLYPRVELLVPKDCQICNPVKQQSNIDYNELTDWLIEQYGEKAVHKALRHNAIKRYGMELAYNAEREVDECLTRLVNHGVINIQAYLESQVNNTSNGRFDFTLDRNPKKATIPDIRQKAFQEKFSIDGLRSAHKF